MTLSFGVSSLDDLLSWSILLLLGGKVLATLLLLRIAPSRRFATAGRRAWWWMTKIAPVAAVPCMIVLALRHGREQEAWLYAALYAAVLVAVPVMVRRRFQPVDPAIPAR